jgi:hypothetical protein
VAPYYLALFQGESEIFFSLTLHEVPALSSESRTTVKLMYLTEATHCFSLDGALSRLHAPAEDPRIQFLDFYVLMLFYILKSLQRMLSAMLHLCSDKPEMEILNMLPTAGTDDCLLPQFRCAGRGGAHPQLEGLVHT